MSAAAPTLILHGAGRMGRQLAAAAAGAGFALNAVVARRRPDWLDADLYAASLEALDDRPDVIVDFSLPDGAVTAARWCAERRVPLVSGTTGLDSGQRAALDAAAVRVPVLQAANFSIGLNVCLELATQLRELTGRAVPAHILDIHHAGKRDAPSGTALALAEAFGGDAGYESVREGDAVGEHRLVLELEDERIELRHEALDRRVFAVGALRAAAWLANCPAGMYTMRDCISTAPQ